eukprot:jgi/Botrbrau1/9628/Bobra.0131s0008.1
MGSSSSSLGRNESEGSSPTSTCPVPEKYRSRAVYNVYNQRIDDNAGVLDFQSFYQRGTLDPRNQMPLEPNQQPCPGQRKLLSTARVESTIPKGGTDVTWLYPSPQMFYNALKRKGKGDDVMETDMESIVHAHNSLNEKAWQEVLVWERLHQAACNQPTLLRFRGRPDELSPLARLSHWAGGRLPFDRHDWYVDRCGTEVRYVIDFYFDEDKAGTPEAFQLRVRPALDNFESGLDRTKLFIYQKFAEYGLPCPVTGSGGHVINRN